jgi:hypothetical protein
LRKNIKIVAMFTQQDLFQVKSKGIEPDRILKQLKQFHNGFPYIRLLRPATDGDGLLKLTQEEKENLHLYFDTHARKTSILKFVPASGAATRMFKNLFEFIASVEQKSPETEKLLNDQGFNSIQNFIANLRKFAFYEELQDVLSVNSRPLDELLSNKDYCTIIEYLLSGKGLNYANLPKALLAFHKYPDGYRVAAEEHLVEAANYVSDYHKDAAIHFTISPEHLEKFNERIQAVKGKYESQFNVHFTICHSIQKSSTDTIAVDEQNNPFRNADGSLLFRPAGHGSLLENLNDTDAEIVFIKNIDNVVPDHLKAPTYEYKKLIGGYLLEMRGLIFDFLQNAEADNITEAEVDNMITLASSRFQISFPEEISASDLEKKKKILIKKLNRPMRVCGMVKNAGEPGGGPFWVENDKGEASLQIVESSQINLKDNAQSQIFCASTHFNPVDLVCCIRDYKGNAFDLNKFVDESTGFISLKSSGGKNLKAMELPGLWNGSMADWITVFVEVPLITFNPVKTINDLLRNEHQ